MATVIDRDTALLDAVRRIADEIAAPNADAIDREARFPAEALEALRAEEGLSAFVPAEFGGGGVRLETIATAVFELGRRCGATGMVFAMHQIQVRCMAVSAQREPKVAEYLAQAAREQLTETGHFLAYRHDDGRICLMPLVGEWTRIGRSLAADIRFDDPTVSRRHAILASQESGVRVLDDRSLNGVFLRGERVEWGELTDGDELIIGRYRLYFIENVAESSHADSGSTAAAA